MGNVCCRNAIYTPTAYFYSARVKKTAPQPPSKAVGSHSHGGSVPPEVAPVMAAYHAGDDCAINELLEGRMDLNVILPDKRSMRMTVERRTPMMDLLVQATTANKISPGGHVIHIWADRGKDFVPYKPSTPIGSLDTNTIYIVPKSAVIDPPVKRLPKVANQPFEQTFRLQVNLPRNQLMVLRVSPRMPLSEVKHMACVEKGLDPSRYQLVSPSHPSQVVDLNKTLSEYGSAEISLLSISCIQANICNTTTDLIAYASREDSKKKKAILGMLANNKKGSSGGSSDDLNDRSSSPSRSDGSGNQGPVLTKPPGKKRPAPPPPPLPCKPKPEPSPVPDDAATTVSHSRHSSDSSGYHEPSLFSDSPDSGSPETSSGSGSSAASSLVCHHYQAEAAKGRLRLQQNAREKPVFVSIATKKRRAPPPPVAKPPADNTTQRSDSTDARQSRSPMSTQSDQIGRGLPPVTIVTSSRDVAQDETKHTRDVPISFTAEPSSLCQITQSLDSNDVQRSDCEDGDDIIIQDPEIGEAVYLSDTDERYIPSMEHKRKESLSSLATLDDIQMSFDQTIEAAKKALEMEEIQKKEQLEEELKAVTNAQMAALNARLDQDVTKQGILSQIEAAFFTVEGQTKEEPSIGREHLLQDWEYAVPYPPSPFGTSKRDAEFQFGSSTSSAVPENKKSIVTINSTSDISLMSQLSAEENTGPSEDLIDEVFEGEMFQNENLADESRRRKLERSNSLQSDMTKNIQNRLQNFSIGFYTSHPKPELYTSPNDNKSRISTPRKSSYKDGEPIYQTMHINASSGPQYQERSIGRLVKSESFSDLSEANSPRRGRYGGPGFRIGSFLERNQRIIPNDNKVYGVEGSVRGIKGQVKLRRAELVDFSICPALNGRSTSMLNLSPQALSIADMAYQTTKPEKRATIPGDRMGRISRAHSEQNLNDPVSSVSNAEKSEFVQEQERLQNEYKKLQKQFLVWQQQLINNQSVLQKKQIMPVTSLPAVANDIQINGHFSTKKGEFHEGQKSKYQHTLQNGHIPQSKSCSDNLSKKRLTHNKPNVNVIINSMKQDSQFSDLSPPRPTKKETSYSKYSNQGSKTANRDNTYKHMKNSMSSYELGKMSNGHQDNKAPKTSIDISLNDFSNGIPFRSNTLRSSNNKTQFKPPQVRSSSKTRQRLPPEVRNEQDVPQQGRVTGSERKCGVTTVNIFNHRENYRESSETRNSLTEDRKEKSKGISCHWTVEKNAALNGHIAQDSSKAAKSSHKTVTNGKDSFQTVTRPPPTPPPLVTEAKPTSYRNGGVSKHGNRPHKKPLPEPTLDPREELMLEIRKFGGRHGLRKISLDSPSWQTNLVPSSIASA